ncbi:SHOCT domain-containing protein [Ornithinibacillus sp. JPR2-1]|uniref:SHOCT domain-containing protein n=1 Tax=Ornithinibacillus sp. JPR2-1 TaxID=2094019 RepID=UPI0031D335A3
MANKECPICGGKVGLLDPTFMNGEKVCKKCVVESGVTLKELTSRGYQNIPAQEIVNLHKRTHEVSKYLEVFNATKYIGKFIEFDDDNKLIMISPKKKPRIYRYKDISSFELLENGESVTKGGLGRALVGGALFGGAGAVVGGVTAKRKNKEIVDSLRIKISLKDINVSSDYIDFLDKKVKKGSFVYKDSYNKVQECLSTLQYICDYEEQAAEQSSNSPADEILKFKNLLDAGAITEEEYNAKKKELLGI